MSPRSASLILCYSWSTSMSFSHTLLILRRSSSLTILKLAKQFKLFRTAIFFNQTSTTSIYGVQTPMHLSLHTDKKDIPHPFPFSQVNTYLFHIPAERVTVNVSQSCKNLGVTFSSDLSWSIHISNILEKAYCSLYFIKRTFLSSSTPIHIKKSLNTCQ